MTSSVSSRLLPIRIPSSIFVAIHHTFKISLPLKKECSFNLHLLFEKITTGFLNISLVLIQYELHQIKLQYTLLDKRSADNVLPEADFGYVLTVEEPAGL